MVFSVKDDRVPVRESQSRVPFKMDQEILQAIDAREEGNEFFYNESSRPEDMSYEWKRLTYGGKEDQQYQAKLIRTGWRPVPAERHPEVGSESSHDFYRGKYNDAIIVGGQILMERHIEYTKRSRAISDAINASQIGSQRESIQQSEESSMPRKITAFKQSYDSGQEIDA